jgi:kumamolisin
MEETMRIGIQLVIAAVTLSVSAYSFGRPITTVLRLKEKVQMQDLAAMVRSPVSLRYQVFFSPQEIKALSAPSELEYQDLIQNLETSGFQILSESPTHLYVSVRADESLYEKVFAIQILNLKTGHHRSLMAPKFSNEFSLIEAVTGLDNTRKAFPKFVHHSNFSDVPQGIKPSAIKSAYHFDPIYKDGIFGKGQHIAIATYNDFNLNDVNFFYKALGLSLTPTLDQIKFNGQPSVDENSALETQLDAEFSGMIAPAASVHVFTSATNDDAGELAMFTAILDDNRAKVANYSWGSCESTVTPQHVAEMSRVFARAVAQGVNIFVASGDSGSDSCQNGSIAADWPTANPDVVSVGGTTLSLGQNIVETAWSGSGGGISGIWDLPKYQTQLGAVFNKRSYPDVAFNADPASGQAVYGHYSGKATWLVIGGTSMAAPQWAGFLALVGEARSNHKKPSLGFLNPLIYSFSDLERASLFHDVVSGSNGAYQSSLGWDAVTGFGSMNAEALLGKLTSF